MGKEEERELSPSPGFLAHAAGGKRGWMGGGGSAVSPDGASLYSRHKLATFTMQHSFRGGKITTFFTKKFKKFNKYGKKIGEVLLSSSFCFLSIFLSSLSSTLYFVGARIDLLHHGSNTR